MPSIGTPRCSKLLFTYMTLSHPYERQWVVVAQGLSPPHHLHLIISPYISQWGDLPLLKTNG